MIKFTPKEIDGKWYIQIENTPRLSRRKNKKLYRDILGNLFIFDIEQHAIDFCDARNAINKI